MGLTDRESMLAAGTPPRESRELVFPANSGFPTLKLELTHSREASGEH
jgi:hypothetical protein